MLEQNELLDKYLNQQLTDQEHAVFEQRLAEDRDFAWEVRVATVLRAEENLVFKKRWKALDMRNKVPEASLRTIRLRRWSWAAGLALLIGLGLGAWLLNRPTELDSLVAQQLDYPHFSPEALRGTADQMAEWSDIRTLYLAGDYASAAQQLERKIAETGGTHEQFFYLGLSRLYQTPAQYTQALEAFAKIDAASVYREEADWFAALAWLRQGNYPEARKLLFKITQEEQWKAQEAAAILKTLNLE